MSLVAPTVNSVVSECSKFVYVTGQLGGSTVRIFQNAATQIGQTVANDASTWVPIDPGVVLSQGDLITATQTLGPDTSPQSPVPMEVQGLPANPPAPIFKTYLYGCARCLYLGGMVPGADYKVMGQDAVTMADELRGSGSSSSGEAHVGLNADLWTGEKLTADYDSCGTASGTATSMPADQYPFPELPPPTINEPLFKCDTNVYGKDFVPGAIATMRRELGGMLVQESDRCSLGQVNFTANPILDAGEEIVMRQRFTGDRCAKASDSSTTAIVQDLSLLEPPQVMSPLCAGGVIVTLTKLRPGAKVFIFHGAETYEGQSNGLGPQDFMVEPLTGGQDVFAIMEHCGVATGESNHVPVNEEAVPIGPPHVHDPLFSCTDVVHVTDIHPGALVQVFSTFIGLIGQEVVYDDEADIPVAPALMDGDEVFAVQSGCGMTSGKSNVVKVQKPDRLKPPTIVTPLYDCGSHVWVKDVIPGAIVEVFVNGAFAGQATIGATEGSVALNAPLEKNDKVKVRQRLCDIVSDFSAEETVEAFIGSWEEIPWIDTNGNVIGDDDKILAVHAALLKTGKIIFFGGDQHSDDLNNSGDVDHTRLLDCTTLRIKKITGLLNPPSDLFCAGHALTKFGDLLVAGGTFDWRLAGEVDHDALGHFIGSRDTWIFDADNEQWLRKGLLNTERPDDFVQEYLAIWQGDNLGATPAEIAAEEADLQQQADLSDPNARIHKTGGKWYPTVIALPDARLTVVSGHPREEDSRHNNNSLETYSLSTDQWTLVGTKDADLIPRTAGRSYEYPRLFVLSDGTLFSSYTMRDARCHKWTIGNDPDNWAFVADGMPEAGVHDSLNGSAVILPFTLDLQKPDTYLPDKILMMGGREPVTIEPLSAAPVPWNTTSARALAGRPLRRNHNSVILPTGEILVEGGVEVTDDDNTGVLEAELYNSYTDTWTVLPAAAVVRNYHHVALLMPNGAVYVGGSNINSKPGLANRHFEIEIFKPWYFCRTRPILTAVPSKAHHGQTINITTPDVPKIEKVVIVKCGSTTHNFNVDQRLIELPLQKPDKPGTLAVTIPTNENIAIQGYYLLFILDGDNVPSEGKFIRIYKSSCFVATAVYGDDTYEVEALRVWRDERLMPHAVGRVFVRAYYVLSLPMVRLVERWPSVAKVARRLLDRVVKIISPEVDKL